MARHGGLVRETSAFAVVRSMEPEVEVARRRASGRRDRCGKASRTALGGSSGGMPRPPSTNAEVCGGERHAPHRPAEAAERDDASSGPSGLTAVMFTDVVGSTRLAAAEGDAAWTARIRSHFALMRRDMEACGRDVVKSLGDGKMSVFGSARDAVAAARRIVESEAGGGQPPALRSRIGIDAWDVVAADDEVFGTVVIRAARIAASAAPGAIRVSDAVAALAGKMRGARAPNLRVHAPTSRAHARRADLPDPPHGRRRSGTTATPRPEPASEPASELSALDVRSPAPSDRWRPPARHLLVETELSQALLEPRVLVLERFRAAHPARRQAGSCFRPAWNPARPGRPGFPDQECPSLGARNGGGKAGMSTKRRSFKCMRAAGRSRSRAMDEMRRSAPVTSLVLASDVEKAALGRLSHGSPRTAPAVCMPT